MKMWRVWQRGRSPQLTAYEYFRKRDAAAYGMKLSQGGELWLVGKFKEFDGEGQPVYETVGLAWDGRWWKMSKEVANGDKI